MILALAREPPQRTQVALEQRLRPGGRLLDRLDPFRLAGREPLLDHPPAKSTAELAPVTSIVTPAPPKLPPTGYVPLLSEIVVFVNGFNCAFALRLNDG